MKAILLSILSVFALVSTVACTNPMDKKITAENYDSVIEETRKKVSADDWKKVEAMIMLSKFAGFTGKKPIDFFEGKSLNELLENVKKANAAQKEAEEAKSLAALKAGQDEAERAEKILAYFEVVSWNKSKNVDRFGIDKRSIVSMKIRNKSESMIDAFEGRILILDKLGNQIGSYGIKETESLKPAAERTLAYDLPTIDFRNKGQEIFDTKSSDLRFKFEPTKLLLKDGTVL